MFLSSNGSIYILYSIILAGCHIGVHASYHAERGGAWYRFSRNPFFFQLEYSKLFAVVPRVTTHTLYLSYLSGLLLVDRSSNQQRASVQGAAMCVTALSPTAWGGAIETPIHNEKKKCEFFRRKKRGRTGAKRSPSMNVEDGRREAPLENRLNGVSFSTRWAGGTPVRARRVPVVISRMFHRTQDAKDSEAEGRRPRNREEGSSVCGLRNTHSGPPTQQTRVDCSI